MKYVVVDDRARNIYYSHTAAATATWQRTTFNWAEQQNMFHRPNIYGDLLADMWVHLSWYLALLLLLPLKRSERAPCGGVVSFFWHSFGRKFWKEELGRNERLGLSRLYSSSFCWRESQKFIINPLNDDIFSLVVQSVRPLNVCSASKRRKSSIDAAVGQRSACPHSARVVLFIHPYSVLAVSPLRSTTPHRLLIHTKDLVSFSVIWGASVWIPITWCGISDSLRIFPSDPSAAAEEWNRS